MERKTIILIKSHDASNDANNVTSNLDELARILITLEHDVRIISFEKDASISPPIFEVARWIPNSLFGFFKTPFAIMKLGMVASLILMLKNSIKPDLIVVENLSFIIPLLKICGNLKIMYVEEIMKNMPIIGQIDNYRRHSKRHQIFYLKYVDKVVVCNQISKYILEDKALNVNKDTMILYPNIYTPKFLEAEYLPPQNIISNLDNDSTVILTFGDYVAESNFDLAIASFEQLQTNFESCNIDNVYLIICGFCNNNAELSYMNNLMDSTIDGHNIIFVKNMSAVLITSLIKLAKCIIFPSIYFNHDQIFLMQSLSMGKIVIATECGITDELIEHEINGYIADPCAEEFVYFIVKVLTEPYTHISMAKRVKRIFSDHHGENQYISRVRHILNHCLHGCEEEYTQDYDENFEGFTLDSSDRDNSQNQKLYNKSDNEEDDSVLISEGERTIINEDASDVITGPPGSTPFPSRILRESQIQNIMGEQDQDENSTLEEESISFPTLQLTSPNSLSESNVTLEFDENDQLTVSAENTAAAEFAASDDLQNEIGVEENGNPNSGEIGTPDNSNVSIVTGSPGGTPFPSRIHKRDERYATSTPTVPSDDDDN